MIFGLSRYLVIAVVVAMTGAGAGLWYVLSEDERTAPVAQRESAATQETAPAQPEMRASGDEATELEAEPEEAAQAPSDETATGTQAAQEAATDAAADGIEAAPEASVADVGEDAVAQSDAEAAQIETLIEEDIAALGDPAAPAPALESEPEAEPEAVQPRLPAFDTVRVEPTGEAVIAGRDAPEGDVALLRDGEVYDETFAGPSGAFVFIPQPFPVGTSDVTLRATDAQGNVLLSRESVTIIVDADRTRMPMVALTAPGRPTEVLSRPEPVTVAEAVAQEAASQEAVPQEAASQDPVPQPEPDAEPEAPVVADTPTEMPADIPAEAPAEIATETETGSSTEMEIAAVEPQAEAEAQPVSARTGVRIVAVEAETGGGLFVSGEAEAQAAIRLYLNDTLVTQAEADDGGDVSFAIRRGVRAGRYQVRLDDVDPATGAVLSRAEVGFTVPEAVAAIPEPQPEAAPVTTTQPAAETEVRPDEPSVAESDEPATIVADAPIADPAPVGEEVAQDMVEETVERIVAEHDSERPEATVTVPELATALVERGDSLWRISRQVYGRGIRYTEIFEANQDQIRNPNLIYPGQVFVLPPDAETVQDGQEAEAPPAQ